jgi:hypothetical protein
MHFGHIYDSGIAFLVFINFDFWLLDSQNISNMVVSILSLLNKGNIVKIISNNPDLINGFW